MLYDEIKELFNNKDKFVNKTGMRVSELEEGKSVVKLTIESWHLNGNNFVQGGVLFTMIDIAGCSAIMTYGDPAVTLNASINYLSAVGEGELVATATVIKKGRQTGLSEVKIYCGEKLIASGSVTVFITAKK